MKPSLAFSPLIVAGSALAFFAADKRRLCIEVCWTYHVLDQTCPDNCLASPPLVATDVVQHPTDEEATLTEECMVGCTTSHISSPAGINMKAYADCRSGCYNKYFAPFINTYRPPGMNKRSPSLNIASSEGLGAPTANEKCALNCFSIYPQIQHGTNTALACHNPCNEFVKEYSKIRPDAKLLSPLPYPPAGRGPNGGNCYKIRPEICQYSCRDGTERNENTTSVSGFKECADKCINSPSFHDQTTLDCSSFCSSDESWAVFEAVDFGSCLDACFTKSLVILVQAIQGIDESNAADRPDSSDSTSASNSAMLKLGESDAVAIDQSPTLVGDGNQTGHVGQLNHVGELNGALSWAESAYHSFWFFAWTLTAVAIAIGTQML